jgi:hypothetical protein
MPEKAAFNEKQHNKILTAVENAAHADLRGVPLELTHNDLLMLFVEPDDRQRVLEGRELFGVSRTYIKTHWQIPGGGDSDLMELGLTMQTGKTAPGFPFPVYMGERTFRDDPEAAEKLDAWVSWRAETGWAWSKVWSLVYELSTRCRTPQEVRFFFPSIVALLQLTGDAKLCALSEKLREFRTPPTVASIPREMRAACDEADITVGRYVMTKGIVSEKPKFRPVTVNGVKLRGSTPTWAGATIQFNAA